MIGHIHPFLPIDSLILDASGIHCSLRTESLMNISISSGGTVIGSNFGHISAVGGNVTTEVLYVYLFFCGGDGMCGMGSLCVGLVVCASLTNRSSGTHFSGEARG